MIDHQKNAPIERCIHCDEPTGRCGEDSLRSQLLDGKVIDPLCEDCFDMFEAERIKLTKWSL